MNVIGAGFGRTGTMSLKLALERLYGEPCYHMVEVGRRPEHIAEWLRAARGEPVDLRAVLAGYAAAVDWPVARFWRELAGLYPEAKVVLTVREPEAWYRSAAETIHPLTGVTSWAPFRWLLELSPVRARFPEMADATVWGEDGHFGGRFTDRAHAIAVYEAHLAEVRAALPPERLLVFRVEEGWEPLCAFLGLPVPDAPFPRTNERASMRRQMRLMTAVGWAAAPVTAPLAALRGRL